MADKIAQHAALDGLPLAMLYPGVIYGPGKLTLGNLIANMMIERFNWRLPGYVGSGNDKYSFCHVDDVVQGHVAAMLKGRPGEGYLLTGENASFMLLFDMSALITGTIEPKFNIPLWMTEAYGWIYVSIVRITGKLPLISLSTDEVLRHQWVYSSEKAKTDLDYRRRNLREGLEELLTWLKS